MKILFRPTESQKYKTKLPKSAKIPRTISRMPVNNSIKPYMLETGSSLKWFYVKLETKLAQNKAKFRHAMSLKRVSSPTLLLYCLMSMRNAENCKLKQLGWLQIYQLECHLMWNTSMIWTLFQCSSRLSRPKMKNYTRTLCGPYQT